MQNKKAERKANVFAPHRNFSPLHDAHTLLRKALLPLSPFRALTPGDITDADPAFTVWEEATDAISILAFDNGDSGRPSTNLLLVEAMLRFCEYGAGIPDISGTDQTEKLRQRFVRLKRHIEEALLAEARSDERLERQERSDARCDLDLVRDWGVDIRGELLTPGQRTEHWTYQELPWILGYLTTWEDIEFSILIESGITLVMKDIIQAPTIPVVSHMQPIRGWATSILSRWKSRPEADALPPSENIRLGLDMHLPSDTPPPSTNTYSTPQILYRIGEIASDIQELGDALTDQTSADYSRIFRALDKLAAWKDGVEPLTAQGIRDALLRFQTTPGLRHPVQEVQDRTYTVIAEFTMPNAHLERRVTSFSYILPADPIFPLIFRDKNGFPETFKGMGTFGLRRGREMPDTRIWQNVAVETSGAVPLNVLFDKFISTANLQHRHPLSPVTNFSFASTLDPFCSYAGKTSAEKQEITRRLWEVSPGRFVQGQVKDLPITDDHTVYYNHSPFGPFAAPDLTMKQPKERTLPPSCIAPKHWIRPSMPPGGDAVWECLPSLAFVGNGHELYPGATSPPAIASHVYVPRSFERLGIYPHAAYRVEVTKDCTPMKLEPPLTAAQAHALLGRAIQYEVPVVPLPPLPEGARPKKKRREDPPAIYWGVVWGVNDVDPATLELKIFTGGQYHEACALLTVGEPCAVPTNRIDPSQPFTPKWVGTLALVDEPEAPEEVSVEPPVPQVEVEDRLASILKIAAKSPRFEVGIGGDCTILAGEIALHGVQESDNSVFTFIQEIENCKPGIWQGGRETGDEFVIWVRWVREGSIDLTQPVENFVVEPQGGVDIKALGWTEVSTVSVDGGTMSILARGVTSPEAIQALTGNDDGDVEGFVECIVLHGAEEDSFHIPGGVSSYTGGDGGFGVYAALDSDGKVVGVKVVGS